MHHPLHNVVAIWAMRKQDAFSWDVTAIITVGEGDGTNYHF